MAERPYLELPLGELLERVADRTPAPGGGSVAGIAAALAAALAGMAARFSNGHWSDAERAAAQAEKLRARAAPLAQLDAEAYAAALEALRAPRDGDRDGRDAAIGEALGRAADVPLAIAEVAADAAVLAAEIAELGNPNLRGDAAAGALLAEAAARIGANLVAVNLAMHEDERVGQAREHAERASKAARRAVAATSS